MSTPAARNPADTDTPAAASDLLRSAAGLSTGVTLDPLSSSTLPTGCDDAATVKAAAAEQRAAAARRMADLRSQAAQADADLARQRADLEARHRRAKADLEARMKPLRQELAQLQEIAWTVDLYLGRDESLRLLRDGTPAASDTPITIRQKVLVMAEESLVLLGRKATGMDADDIEHFVTWLLEDNAHLDRILPDTKGVVVLVPTRVKTDSGNVFENVHRDAANSRAWWLIRNGQRLYLLTTDPDLRVTDRVLPHRSEFTDIFNQRLFGTVGSTRRVEPGSSEWLKLEQAADARRRHYMRLMLVLQGIIDRTPVWAPLPGRGINLLDVRTQDDGRVVLIQDGDTSTQLGDGRESFADWQRRLNQQLRPGLRIVGNWSNQGFADLYRRGDAHYRGGHPRLYPRTVDCRPDPDQPHLLEGRRDGGFFIRFERTDQVWRRNVPVPDEPGYVYREKLVTPTKRASCVVKPTDMWVLPFDLVTQADLRYYLDSRDDRSSHFLTMVPALRAALAAKEAEAAQEAPFRALLGGMLVTAGAEDDRVEGILDDLVTWWKAAHTWARPLNGEPRHEARAAADIVAEFTRRQESQGAGRDTLVAAGRAVTGVIAVARTRAGDWFAYAPSTPAHDAGVFLDITPIRKDGTLRPVKRWQRVQQRTATALHVAWKTAAWDSWAFTANPRHYLTGPERDQLIEQIRTEHPAGSPLCVTEFFDPATPATRYLTLYSWTGPAPEDAPARPTARLLSWHSEHTDPFVSSVCRQIVKDTDGARLGPHARPSDIPRSFAHFSSGRSRWGDTPWWPDDARDYGDVRPRLVWADETMLDRLKAYTDRCAAAAKTEKDQRRKREADIYRYSTPTHQRIVAARTQALHDRFVEDFGADAEDLWPAHLASLPEKTRVPAHPRDVWTLIACALDHGHTPDGMSLADLAAEHKQPMPGQSYLQGRFDTGDFGAITVPNLTSPPTDHET